MTRKSPSLRRRVAAAVVAATVPLLPMALFLLHHVVRTRLYEDLKGRTLDTAQVVARLVEYDPNDGFELEGGPAVLAALAHGREPAHVRVLFPDGRRIESPGFSHALDAAAALGAANGGFVSAEVTTRPAGAPAGDAVRIVALRKTTALQATGARLTAVFVALGAIGTLLAGLAAAAAVRRGLRPLDELRRRIDAAARDAAMPEPGVAGLPSELLPVAATVHRTLRRLDAAREREQVFAGAVAHELRTPVQVLAAALDAVLTRPGLPAHLEGDLRDLREEVASLSGTLDALLVLRRARQAAGNHRRGSVSVDRVLRDALRIHEGQARQRDVVFAVEGPRSGSVLADPERLRIVLSNLVDNAIRHGAPASTVRVLLHTEGEIVSIRNRVGPTSRASSDRQEHAGLGLAIARALAEEDGLRLETSCRDGFFLARLVTG